MPTCLAGRLYKAEDEAKACIKHLLTAAFDNLSTLSRAILQVPAIAAQPAAPVPIPVLPQAVAPQVLAAATIQIQPSLPADMDTSEDDTGGDVGQAERSMSLQNSSARIPNTWPELDPPNHRTDEWVCDQPPAAEEINNQRANMRKQERRPWYDGPALWFAIGLGLFVLLIITILLYCFCRFVVYKPDVKYTDKLLRSYYGLN